jgi:hypothetical protein
MTGGYVKYIGVEASLLNMKVPSGSGRKYSFPNGKYILVENAVDYKFYEFKAKANPKDWVAKTRLADGEKVFGSDRPKPDPNSPEWKIERERLKIREDFDAVKTNLLRMNARMLPEEKAALRKMLEEKEG